MSNSDARAGGLEFIRPLQVGLSIDGVDLTITPIVMRELPNLLALAMPVFASLNASEPRFIERMQSGELTAVEVSSLLTSVVVNGEEFVGLLALCARQPKEWIGGLLLDRAAELALVCLQVNADFFRRAMPGLRMLASQARDRAGVRLDASAPSPAAYPSATPTASSS